MHNFFLFLQVYWFFAIGAVLIIYACTAGFDFGTTIMLPFFKKEQDRRVMLNVIAPTWDGNQTWLVFGGGAIFVIWPMVYASIFSGFYAAMMFILWSFFLRPPGMDYRSKINKYGWRRMWDWGLFISSFFPVILFGVALGNFLHGVPIHFDDIFLRPYYEGNFWGLLNLPGCFCGTVALLMVLMHATTLQYRRTEGGLKEKFKKLFYIFSVLFLCLFTITGLIIGFAVKGYVLVHSPVNPTEHILDNMVTMQRGAWILSYAQYPWKVVAPIVAYFAVFAAMIMMRISRGTLAFWFSCLAVAGTVATAGTALFPFVVPSSLHPNQSITIWNGTSDFYTLGALFFVSLVLLTVILIYKIYVYRAVWHRKSTLTIQDIEKEEHMSY